MKQNFFLFLMLASSFLYADLQTLSSGGITVGLYDDTSFGFSFSIGETGVFLKPNRPPTSLVMMKINDKIIPIGSAVGFFHQRPVVTNNTLLVIWEARELIWSITISPTNGENNASGFLFRFNITNIGKKTVFPTIQVLLDVFAPFENPVVVGNNSLIITQESLWQGKNTLKQWAVYSRKNNLAGITVIPVEPFWQSVAFAQWKSFYDYPGETVISKASLFTPIPTVGATFFYPPLKIAPTESKSFSFWMGKTLPPSGVVIVEKPKPPLVEEKTPLPTNTATPPTPTNEAVVQKEVTNEVAIQKEVTPEIFTFTVDQFPFARFTMTADQTNALEAWFSRITDSSSLWIDLTGHTDSRGSKQRNYQLGLKRAQNVANWLIQKGVPSSHIRIFSRGEQELKDPTNNALNRRVEIQATRKKP